MRNNGGDVIIAVHVIGRTDQLPADVHRRFSLSEDFQYRFVIEHTVKTVRAGQKIIFAVHFELEMIDLDIRPEAQGPAGSFLENPLIRQMKRVLKETSENQRSGAFFKTIPDIFPNGMNGHGAGRRSTQMTSDSIGNGQKEKIFLGGKRLSGQIQTEKLEKSGGGGGGATVDGR